MIEKLKSRKLWVTFGTIIAIIAVRLFELPIDLEQIYAIAGLAGVYVAAQGYVDGKPSDSIYIAEPTGGQGGEDVLH